ncbi:MAG: hypothetical protein AB1711_09890 [Thermodesulfobacteriota bacterium]
MRKPYLYHIGNIWNILKNIWETYKVAIEQFKQLKRFKQFKQFKTA